MKNRTKLLIILIVAPLLMVSIGASIFLTRYDARDLFLDPQGFITKNFPNLYYTAKSIALQAGGEDISAGKQLGVPLIELNLSRNDKAHFENLYKGLSDQTKGVEYYSKNNTWRKASLKFDDKEYRVKVKAHGRNPTDHQEQDFISLAVKLEGGETVMDANRFSLIVRSRIYTNRLLLLQLADLLKLKYLPDQLVRVKIKGMKEKYFFFEPKFDNKYMEVKRASSFRRIEFAYSETESTDKSLVRATDRDPYTQAELSAYLKQGLLDQGVPEAHHEHIITHYVSLNEAIAKRKLDIKNFFNEDYIARYDALVTIMGFVGHQWMRSNFYVFFNQSDGKFYPAITRDAIPSELKLNGNDPIEKQLNSSHHALTGSEFTFPLLAALSANDEHRQRKYKKIAEMLQDYALIEKEQSRLRDKMNSIHDFGLASSILQRVDQFKTDLLPKNLATVEKYLEQAEPAISISGAFGQLTVVIDPQSQSNISFNNFKIKIPHLQKQSSFDFKIVIKEGSDIIGVYDQLYKDIEIAKGTNIVDLTPILQNLFINSGQDAWSNSKNREYILVIKNPEFDFSNISASDISVEMQNVILDKPINSTQITIREIDKNNDKLENELFNRNHYHTNNSKNNFEAFREKFAEIAMSKLEDDKLVIHSGSYELVSDFIVPDNLKLVIEKATTLKLGENVSILGFNGIEVNGTKSSPVIVSSIDLNKPYGSIGILGDEKTRSTINYLHQSNGSEAWVRGAFFSGGLSIHYQESVHVANSKITQNKADDGINLKYINDVKIYNTIFKDNYADQIDLDYTNAIVDRSKFVHSGIGDLNGDGLDVSGSKIIVSDTKFSGFRDKGMSIGEQSYVLLENNTFEQNNLGAAVKDKSHAYFLNNSFKDNTTDISAYMKKGIFGGGNIYLLRDITSSNAWKLQLDAKSSVFEIDQTLVQTLNTQVDNDEDVEHVIGKLIKQLEPFR